MSDFFAAALLAAAVLGGGYLGAALAKHVGQAGEVTISQAAPSCQHTPVHAQMTVADGR
jgi:hypothetical protein